MRRLMGVFFAGFVNLSVAFAQTTYYVAANGNDANDGRSTGSPFQSLGKVNSLNLQAGDQVLFRRGDTFRGTLIINKSGNGGQPIVYDAYGSGAKPVLAASTPVTNWNSLGNGVWQASCASCGSRVTGLFRNGNDLPLGRYPNASDANKGYLTIQSHSGSSQITSQQGIPLNLNTGWNGAEVVIRTTQWITDRYGLSGQSGNTLNLTSNPNTGYAIQDNWGFFVQNHPATLDQPGEWAFDVNSKTFRLYDPVNNPNNQTITATVQERGVDLSNVSNVTLRNLRLTESLTTGLFAYNVNNLTISSVDITDAGEDGMSIFGGGSNVLIENSTLLYAHNNGLSVDPYSNFTFRGSTLRHAGVDAGRGRSGDGQGNGMRISGGQNILIENNTIDSVGYNGINYVSNTIIQRNVISNFCFTKSDGGGLYTWNGTRANVANNRILNNVIFNGLGAPEGTPGGAYSGANGIFFDDCTQNAEVGGNTVYNCHGLGINLRAASTINIHDNTVYNNGEGQLQLAYNQSGCFPRGNTVTGNVLVSRLFDQFVAKYESNQNDLTQYGSFDNNYYVRPFEKDFVIRAVWNYGPGLRGADFCLDEWRSRFGQDARTSPSPLTYPDYVISSLVGSPQLNSNFNGDLNGWSVLYSDKNNGQANWDNTGKLDGGSLRVSFAPASGETWFYNSRVMVGQPVGPVTAGKRYVLRFDAVASSTTKRVQAFLQATGNVDFYFNPRTQPLVGTGRQRYEVVFSPAVSLSSATAGVQVYEDGAVVWLDNISFQEVTTTPVNPDDYIKFLVNPTAQATSVAISGNYRDVKNQPYSGGTIPLAPFSSLILLKDNGTTPPPPPPLATLRDPENPTGTTAGLTYGYYELSNTPTQLPDFNSLTPTRTGTVSTVDLSPRQRDNNYGLHFTGYVSVPTDGQYTFYTTSDDGSKLYIGSTEVVSNDALQPPTERSGTIGLKAGVHAITIVYFQAGGGQALSVSYSGPNLNKQIIPASAFSRINTNPPPSLRAPDNPANAVAGLNYEYYEYGGGWTNLPNFATLTPVKTGTASTVDLSPRQRDNNYALRFTGYVSVPTDGQYTFYTTSDDGSKLYIGSTEVVSNDALQPPTERSGTIGLKAGMHAITITYFQEGGGQALSVSYAGPNLNKQTIPASAFFRVGSNQPPSNLRAPENPANAVNGLTYGYYEGAWTSLPDFNSLTPTRTGTVSTVDLSPRQRDNNYGLRFMGYVSVPTDGQYTFYTTSDDGSKLYIGSTEVVSNDALQPPTERSGTIGLKAGVHALTIVYFQAGGGQALSVSYAGPGIPKQVIPNGAFYYVPTNQPSGGTGTGLRAEYFTNTKTPAGSPTLTRIDPTVNFDWGYDSPALGINVDNFAARWTGQVEAPVTGGYTFTTISDDGVRLWVNGVLVINNWSDHPPTTDNSPIITLTAGQKYDIRMEYYESAWGAVAKLQWSYPGQSQQVIPQNRLYPAAAGARVATVSENEPSSGVDVYPNPAQHELRIRYPAEAAGEVRVELISATAQPVIQTVQSVEPGDNLIRLPVRTLPRGWYVLTLTAGSQRVTRKVILTE